MHDITLLYAINIYKFGHYMDISNFLEKKGYCKIALEKNEIGHYQLPVSINGIDGNFILDTGASSSCVDTNIVDKYNLTPEESEHKAAGAGAIDMETFQSDIESITIGEVHIELDKIILFDLTQINEALVQHSSNNIDGIIGADILEQHKAIISYEDKAVFLM